MLCSDVGAKKTPNAKIGRMYYVHPSVAKLYYLRMLWECLALQAGPLIGESIAKHDILM
jgi:hypothetical protein